jgi:T5SS/PEP-CTERM-associated repeat protein
MTDTYVWNAANGSGAFDVSANWRDVTTGANPASAPPGSGDTALIGSAGVVTGTGTVQELDLYPSSGTLTLAGATLQAGTATLSGNLVLRSSTSLATTGTLALRGASTVVAVASGSTLSSAGMMTVGGAGDSVLLTLSGAGTKLVATDTTGPLPIGAEIGNGGTGTVKVVNGATLAAAGTGIAIGAAHGTGTLVVSGAGSSGSAGMVEVGMGGTGTLDVLGGATFTASSLGVGFDGFSASGTAPGNGSVVVSGAGSTLTVAGSLLIAGEPYQGTVSDRGTVTIGNGATLVAGGAQASGQPAIGIANQSYSAGTLDVAGAGTTATAKGSVLVGNYGNGTLDITGGAHLAIQGGTGGLEVAAYGTLTHGSSGLVFVGSKSSVVVSGAGSLLDAGTGAVTIGAAGQGTLVVANGASFRSDPLGGQAAVIGAGSSTGETTGGSGLVLVNGMGSSWVNSGALDVGTGTTGALDVEGGGLVSTHTLTIGSTALASKASVDVSGNSSLLTVQNDATLVAGKVVLAGGSLDVGGTLTLDAGQTLSGNGTVQAGSIVNDATVVASGGRMTFIGDIGGSGTLAIAGNASLSLDGGAASGQAAVFEAAGHGLLDLADPATFAGHIAGFAATDQIDLEHVAATGLSYAGQTLTVAESGGNSVQLKFSGSYSASSFAFAQDGQGGTLITHT